MDITRGIKISKELAKPVIIKNLQNIEHVIEKNIF